MTLTKTAEQLLKSNPWPGNVRELQHTLERVVIMNESGTLQADDFLFLAKTNGTDEASTDSYNLDDTEKKLIIKAISKNNGNMTQAAKELGLTRASLYRRLEKYGL